MSRDELLKRWSKLAPGECVFVSSHALSVGIGLHAILLPLTRPEEGILMLALIEAIRARGWYFLMQSTDYGIKASVNSIVRNHATEPEACDALLLAYLAALHAHCNHESHCCVVNGCPPASYGTK